MGNVKSYKYLCTPYKIENDEIVSIGNNVPINSKFSLIGNKGGLEYVRRECQKQIDFELNEILIWPLNKNESVFIYA